MAPKSLSLAETLERVASIPPGRPCATGKLLASLDEEDRHALEAALAAESLTVQVIKTALQETFPTRSDIPSYSTIYKHRRGVCSCPHPTAEQAA